MLVAPVSARPALPPRSPEDELDDPGLLPDRRTLRTVIDGVESVGDPLAPLVG